jgi:hypothetical protein
MCFMFRAVKSKAGFMASACKSHCVQLVFISFSLFCGNGEIICLLLMSFIGHVETFSWRHKS